MNTRLSRKAGIYALAQPDHRAVYVGQTSRSTTERRRAHLDTLKRQTHNNKPMQELWNKTNGEGWKFSVLEHIPPDIDPNAVHAWLNEREHFWHVAFTVEGYTNLSPLYRVTSDRSQYQTIGVRLPDYLHIALEILAPQLEWQKSRLLSEYVAEMMTPERLEAFVLTRIERRAREHSLEWTRP